MKKGLILMVMVMAVILTSVVVEAQNSTCYEGYVLGFSHGSNGQPNSYPGFATYNDYVRCYYAGYADGQARGYYPNNGYNQNGNGGYQNGYPYQNNSGYYQSGGPAIVIPLPPPPPFGKIGHRHHRK